MRVSMLWALLSVFLIDSGLCGCAKAGAGGGNESTHPDNHAWQVGRVNITDAGYKDPSATVATMLLPHGWQTHGQGTYILDCVFSPPGLGVQAASADGSLALDIYPGRIEAWSDDPGMVQSYKTNYADFSKFRLCQVRPPSLDAVMHDDLQYMHMEPDGAIQPLPGMGEQLEKSVKAINAQLLQSQAGSIVAHAGRMHFHGQHNGHAVEGWLNLVLVTRTLQLPNGRGNVYLSKAPLGVAMYAPPGQLEANEKLFIALSGTLQVDPQWQQAMTQYAQGQKQTMDNTYARIAQIHNQMALDNLRTQQKIAAIHQGVADYSAQVHANVARDRSNAMDHSAQQFSLYMGDQAVYRNPQTGERVQMSSGYAHAWASGNGNSNEYVLTDSPSYNPNGQVGSGSWTELQVEH